MDEEEQLTATEFVKKHASDRVTLERKLQDLRNRQIAAPNYGIRLQLERQIQEFEQAMRDTLGLDS